ncbi:MAG: nucleoside deaminase [Bacteroidales bacterium]|nr:nucleoside deaminase [Bacteroidales bacterium]
MRNDKYFLSQAVELARNGIIKGGGPFGAVISKEGEIIAEANNLVVLSADPTAHAEILAIRKASVALKTHDLSGCVIYTSCEPCPMCLGAIYWARIKKVVYASTRLDAAASGFSDNLIYDEMILSPGERKIDFIFFPDAGGKDVFREWDKFEKKIPY